MHTLRKGMSSRWANVLFFAGGSTPSSMAFRLSFKYPVSMQGTRIKELKSTLEHSIGTAESGDAWSEIDESWWGIFDFCRRAEAIRPRLLTKSLMWSRRFLDADFLDCDLGIRR